MPIVAMRTAAAKNAERGEVAVLRASRRRSRSWTPGPRAAPRSRPSGCRAPTGLAPRRGLLRLFRRHPRSLRGPAQWPGAAPGRQRWSGHGHRRRVEEGVQMRVVTDDGVGLEVVEQGTGPDAPARARVRWGEGGLRRPGRRAGGSATTWSRSTTGATARATRPTDPASYSIRPARAGHAGGRGRASVPTSSALLGHSLGGMVVAPARPRASAAGRGARSSWTRRRGRCPGSTAS